MTNNELFGRDASPPAIEPNRLRKLASAARRTSQEARTAATPIVGTTEAYELDCLADQADRFADAAERVARRMEG